MSNLVLPNLPGLTFPVSKTPTWKTVVQEAESGKETRYGLWSFPRWLWSLQYEFLRNDPTNAHDELWPLIGFFNQHQGSYDSWLFNDPDDNSVTDQAFGVGDGTTTQFQLARTRGGYVEPVVAVNALTNIKKAGVVQSSPANYSINSVGLVTFTAAPAAGATLTWTGTFYWRCRFKEDTINASKFAASIWELKKLEFVSLK